MMWPVSPRPHLRSVVEIVLYGDVLDPWAWIAERRISLAADGFHGRFTTLRHAPLPRRWEPRAPTTAERRARARELQRAAREPDAPPLSPALWSDAGIAPLGSAPALIAVAAARLGGDAAAEHLRAVLREAALVEGIDVSRRDVIIELAARAGLNLARFLPALEASATERALLDEIGRARELGVDRGPALVIDDDWLVRGLRSLRDYRLLFKRYLAVRAGTSVEHTVH